MIASAPPPPRRFQHFSFQRFSFPPPNFCFSPAPSPFQPFSFQLFSSSNLIRQVRESQHRPDPSPTAVALNQPQSHHPRRREQKRSVGIGL
jgi:hypothetical protein